MEAKVVGIQDLRFHVYAESEEVTVKAVINNYKNYSHDC